MTTKLKDFVIAVGSSGSNSGSPDIALVFSGNPAADDTLTVGSVTFTFVASGATALQINIGAGLAATLANITTKINGNATISPVITASDNGSTTLTITSDTTGPANNNFPIRWVFATATINPDGAGASTTGNRTLDGGAITLTGGSGFKAIEIWGDGSVRFTTAGGQLVHIRDVQLNKLLAEIIRDQDNGLGPDHKLFGVTP